MGRGKEFREKRRRGFDDDDFAPPPRSRFGGRPAAFSSAATPAAAPSGPAVRATVKWFNPEKGFGFVAVEGGGDAFLHAAVLGRAGREEVAPGATLEVRTGPGQKGVQVTEVISVDDSTATPARPRSGPGERASGPRRPQGPAVRMAGTTKWFDPVKGFGFVSVEGGSQAVFVHVSVLERGGIPTLAPGQRVTMDVAEGRRNPEAVTIQLAE